jgi:hypothetical protein
MTIKFFKTDVIGKQPKKVGDKFTVQFMGRKARFAVTEFCSGCFFAELV